AAVRKSYDSLFVSFGGRRAVFLAAAATLGRGARELPARNRAAQRGHVSAHHRGASYFGQARRAAALAFRICPDTGAGFGCRRRHHLPRHAAATRCGRFCGDYRA
nr:hypothetical protein [Tanacetum cinerariifolium]